MALMGMITLIVFSVITSASKSVIQPSLEQERVYFGYHRGPARTPGDRRDGGDVGGVEEVAEVMG